MAWALIALPALTMSVGAAQAEKPPAAPEPILDSGLSPDEVEQKPYRDYVRQCLDLLIEHGTDRYGPVRTPLLVAILDVRTRQCPENPLPLDEHARVLRRDRRAPAGNNLYLDQATIRTMCLLTKLTGDACYERFARQYLAYAMQHLIDERGLFWWGWHRHYDVFRDKMTGHQGNPHEIHVQEAAWPELWSVDPQAVRREIEGVWQWHVIDKRTGEINRHADGQRGCDFAMTAGEIVHAFAFLYHQTREPVWLERARLVADYHWKARDPQTGLTPNRPNAGAARFDGSHFDTSITAFLVHGLLCASELTGQCEFRDQAVAHLKAYAKYGYDGSSGQFWGSLRLDGTPVPGPRDAGGEYARYEPRGQVDLWQPYSAGYEHPLAAAQAYAQACQSGSDPELLQAARRWADCVRRQFPPRGCQANTWYARYARDFAPHGTYAEHYGRVISFALQMEGLTGDAAYRDFARQAAREAVVKLWYNGLFRGHPAKPYYEAMDGVGYLLNALLQLDQVLAGRQGVRLDNW
jgi:hypothetical protein